MPVKVTAVAVSATSVENLLPCARWIDPVLVLAVVGEGLPG